MRQPVIMRDVTIITTTGSVYEALGREDAAEMLVKAQLAEQIGAIIKRRRLNQTQAAELVGLPQPACPRCCVGSSEEFQRRR